jgi:hypothetical protein
MFWFGFSESVFAGFLFAVIGSFSLLLGNPFFRFYDPFLGQKSKSVFAGKGDFADF